MSQRPGQTPTALLPRTRHASPLPAGTRVGAYTLRAFLGEGGMGATIYEAVQESPQRLVALKVLPASAGESAIAQFRSEGDALARVRHPHVVVVHDSGLTREGDAFLAMELVADALTLDAYVRQKKPPLAKRVQLMIELCSAVAEAHRLGLVHRDLKPSNVLIGQDGCAKLIDFGITTGVNADGLGAAVSHVASQPHGTPAYMSPEQARGRGGAIDARSDVYSLGVILFELLTDTPLRAFEPQDHQSDRWLARILDTAPPMPSRFDSRLRGDVDRVVLRALAHDPPERYANADQLGIALRALLNDTAPPDAAEGPLCGSARALRRLSRRFFAATLLLCTIAGVALGTATFERQMFNVLHFAAMEPKLLSMVAATPLEDRMSSVTMVVLDDAFDSQHVRQTMLDQDIAPDPQSLASIRRLHAVLIDRLVAANVKAIAFDLYFGSPSDGDATLIEAVERAKLAGVPVLSVAQDWDETLGTLPAFRSVFLFGGAEAGVGEGAWEMYLASETQPGNVTASLSLASWLAARSPQARWQFWIESPRTLRMRGMIPAPGVDAQGRPRERVGESLSVTATSFHADDSPTSTQARHLRLRVLIPDDAYLTRSSVRYAQAVARDGDAAQLRAACMGRIAFIGDLRQSGEERHPHYDGRMLPAFYANAVGLEALSRSASPEVLPVSGTSVFVALLLAATAGTLLALLKILREMRSVARGLLAISSVIVAIAAVAISISLVAAATFNSLINPGPLLVAGLSAWLLALAARRWTRAVLT